MVAPYYEYCNIIWAVESTVALNQLFLTQKRAIRLISGSNWRSHTKPILKKFRILPIESINKLQVGCFMYRALHDMLPIYFGSMFVHNFNVHSHFTRHSVNLHQIHCRLKLRQRTLRIYGPILWNSLPSHISQAVSVQNFCSLYKTYLLTNM